MNIQEKLSEVFGPVNARTEIVICGRQVYMVDVADFIPADGEPMTVGEWQSMLYARADQHNWRGKLLDLYLIDDGVAEVDYLYDFENGEEDEQYGCEPVRSRRTRRNKK